jgi:hypothetical protein
VEDDDDIEPIPAKVDEDTKDADEFIETPTHLSEQRLLIKELTSIVHGAVHDRYPSERVQFSMDMLYVAACERIIRILRSDIDGDPE